LFEEQRLEREKEEKKGSMDELVVKKREQDGPFITKEIRNSVCTHMLADDPPPPLHSRRHADQW